MAFVPIDPLVNMSLLGGASTKRLSQPNLPASSQLSLISPRPLTLLTGIISISYDIPVETVDAVMSVYYGATAAVKSDGDISEYFDLGVGVLQGDTLAPYLFVLVIDWIMRNAVPDA